MLRYIKGNATCVAYVKVCPVVKNKLTSMTSKVDKISKDVEMRENGKSCCTDKANQKGLFYGCLSHRAAQTDCL